MGLQDECGMDEIKDKRGLKVGGGFVVRRTHLAINDNDMGAKPPQHNWQRGVGTSCRMRQQQGITIHHPTNDSPTDNLTVQPIERHMPWCVSSAESRTIFHIGMPHRARWARPSPR